jgi:cytochrome c peroxidase
LFHDGRLEEDAQKPTGFRTPLDADMAKEFQGAISAQAMFPVLSGDEMAGQYSENDISKTVRIGILTGPAGAWQKIADRVAAIPEYQRLFNTLDDNKTGKPPIQFTDIANAIADFIASEFKADNSPWDQYLKSRTPLEPRALTGAALFYGKANCASCHSGKFQSDHQFHAIAMLQFGPGRNARFEGHQRDVGRMRVTGKPEDIYKFRTPSLRNITLSAPYGHTGAYPTLQGIIRHHLDPVASFGRFKFENAQLPPFPTNTQDDFQIMKSPADREAILAANQLPPMTLSDAEIFDLIAFLESLTDRAFQNRLGIPASVPSGLPVDP